MAMTKKIQPRDSVLTLEDVTTMQIAARITDLENSGFYVISTETSLTHAASGDVVVTHIYYRKVDAV